MNVNIYTVCKHYLSRICYLKTTLTAVNGHTKCEVSLNYISDLKNNFIVVKLFL